MKLNILNLKLLCSVLFLAQAASVLASDVNGDGVDDFSIWRPANLTFYTKSPVNDAILTRTVVGDAEHGVPLIGDINGNGRADFAVWYADSGRWSVRYDDDSRAQFQLGQTGDIPFLADLNGDGSDDLIVRRPEEGRWYYLVTGDDEIGQFDFGRHAIDLPLIGYFDNDNRADFAVWRDGTWYIRHSTTNTTYRRVLGRQEGDIKLPADYDGDGMTDMAIWRPSTGRWYIYYSSEEYPDGGSRYERVFGKQSTDIPVPADYDGDGKADLAIRRPTTGEFIYLSSNSGQVVRLDFGRQETDIPALAAWPQKSAMLVAAPANNGDGDSGNDGGSEQDAASFYAENISANIVQTRCVACHISGGAADGQARLILEPSTTPDYMAINQQRISDFLALDDVSLDYFLSKASGGSGHVGGAQLPVGSENYENFATWLSLITSSDSDSGGSSGSDSGNSSDSGLDGFWQGATLLSAEMTFRRAMLLLTGAVPDADELANVSNADDQALRQTILNNLSGNGFHQFLLTAANDRLLTDKFFERGMEGVSGQYFPEVAYRNYEAGIAGEQEAIDNYWTWRRGVEIGVTRAPLELIAYIVENDRPYTEIVTADYTMLNRFSNEALRGSARFASDATAWEFKPGQITGAMIHDESYDAEWTEFGLNITSEGTNINWPHSGLLNDLAWLNRYPSTATNRNRARSRWTYFHFLDFDIEKSAQRTQDADALADTDNPTMNNTNCTVCHQTLDPVAGAYQDYGDWGNYRDQWGGKDSLHWTYKYSDDGESLYQQGDTWYRDMRDPGLENTLAPNNQDSMQWLGQQIASDPRFAIAMVKFFWSGIFGSEPLSPPQSVSDANYNALNEAFVAQSTFIVETAESLQSHGNLREMLVDLVMSPWFRLATQSDDAEPLQTVAAAGTERLLTPEELEQKTYALTGYQWNAWEHQWNHFQVVTEWDYNYNIMYGGIDSVGVTKRAREMTSIMSQVAMAHATEASCSVILEDMTTEDNQRRLFRGITRETMPGVVVSRDVSVDGLGASNSVPYEMNFSAEAGTSNISFAYTNDTWISETRSHQDLIVDHISIYDSQNNAVLSVAGSDIDIVSGTPIDGICSDDTWNDEEDSDRPTDRVFWRNCSVTIPVEFEQAGDYSLVMEAYYQEYNENGELEPGDTPIIGSADVTMSLTVTDPVGMSSPSGDLVRSKMVELVARFWGQEYDINHPEITRLMQLFNDTRLDKLDRSSSGLIYEWNNDSTCNFDVSDWSTDEQWGGHVIGQDPVGALAGWRAVMTYLMTDYQYLHD